MVGVEFFGDFDLASAAIWAFWIFFAGLVIYLQTENQREGFPLRTEDDEAAAHLGIWQSRPEKTFLLRDGRGELTVPSMEYEESKMRRDLAMTPAVGGPGSPYIPTGNPMADGVGPAAWAPRADHAELDAHGHIKIRPMAMLEGFHVSAGRDPRGLPVVGGDGKVVGRVTDMWIDVPEALVRYMTVDLNPEGSGKTRLIPINMARILPDRVKVGSLHEGDWDGVPKTKAVDAITLLEEEKITAYFAGGLMYAGGATG